ncbi:bifunctional DNA primase/polymerase [Catellatospora tritici]|uniref:bifunctional DNA primase/polymerase n=1 Tax=Catellatospora tritici TaxID=2851566 RepID=UPI0020C53E7A|nr:bifunctional DNA primase/polymerase [Catellatospora tritici]
MLAAALRYAANGWPVFLLGRSKRPVALCAGCETARRERATHDPQGCPCLTCHGFYAATTDPQRIAAMLRAVPRGLLAIRTGLASGLVVIDVDPRNGGTASLHALIARGFTPPTRYVRTGAGGLHLYYRHPGGIAIPCDKGIRLGPGIDVKADGGYVVAPPSRHPDTGRPYLWADQGTPMKEAAPALVSACVADDRRPAPVRPAGHPVPPRSGGAASYPDRLMATLAARISQAPQGKRRVTLFGCARGAARMVAAGQMTSIDAYDQLVAACDAAGWPWAKTTPNAIAEGFAAEGVTL